LPFGFTTRKICVIIRKYFLTEVNQTNTEFIKSLLTIQGTILIFVSLGFYFGKRGVIDDNARGKLSSLVLRLILPCNIIASFMTGVTRADLFDCAEVFLIALAAQILCVIVSRFVFPKAEESEKAILRYSVIVSNATFIGLPVIGSIYGVRGTVLCAVAVIPMRIMMWTAGISLFEKANGGKMKQILKVLRNPCMLAVYIGIVLSLTGWKLPSFAEDAVVKLSNCTAAMTLLLVGSVLSNVNFKTIASPKIFIISAIRLVIIPAALCFALKPFNFSPEVAGTVCLMYGMPAATTSVMLAKLYGGNEQYAGKVIFASTLLSLITVPLVALLAQW